MIAFALCTDFNKMFNAKSRILVFLMCLGVHHPHRVLARRVRILAAYRELPLLHFIQEDHYLPVGQGKGIHGLVTASAEDRPGYFAGYPEVRVNGYPAVVSPASRHRRCFFLRGKPLIQRC
jgi:hypothetical protein